MLSRHKYFGRILFFVPAIDAQDTKTHGCGEDSYSIFYPSQLLFKLRRGRSMIWTLYSMPHRGKKWKHRPYNAGAMHLSNSRLNDVKQV
jgi:hypothetical protein